MLPNCSKYREGDYNILLISNQENELCKKNYDNSAIITTKKELILPNDKLDYINNPDEVFLIGMLDSLEVWNIKDLEMFDKSNSQPLDQIIDKSPDYIKIRF